MSVQVTEGLAPTLLEQVRDGRRDLAFAILPAEAVPGVDFVAVTERPLCVIAESGTPPARRTSVPLWSGLPDAYQFQKSGWGSPGEPHP